MNNWLLGADIYHGNSAEMKTVSETVEFLFHKTSQGTDFVDDKFKERYALAKHYELPIGGYHFLEAKTASAGVAEAVFFNRILRERGYGAGDLPPSCDMEAGATTTGARAFIEQVKKIWGSCILYCSVSVVPSDWAGATALWAAEYGVEKPDTVKYPNVRRWNFWQSTDGRVGIQPHSLPGLGPCDVDWFRGGKRKLNAMLLK